MDATTLFLGLILGSIGFGYFLYGKKQKKAVPLVSGIILSILPYFGLHIAITIIVGIILCATPFIMKN